MIDPDELYFSSDTHRALVGDIFDWIQQEEFEEMANNSIKASKCGLVAWEKLLSLMKQLNVRNIYELPEHVIPTIDLLHWADYLTDELSNACREDKSLLSEKLKFCKSYVEMHEGFLDKDVSNLGNIRTSLAQTYYQIGELEVADTLFRGWLQLEPDWGWGWIGWSDCFWLWKFLGIEMDYDKAEKLLRKGLSIPNVRNKNMILERLQDLFEERDEKNQ